MTSDKETREEETVESPAPVDVWPSSHQGDDNDAPEPPESGAPIRPTGPAHDTIAHGESDDVVHEQGDSRGRMVGGAIAFVGTLVYLHGLWASANAVLRGAATAEQTIWFFGQQLVQGTAGLILLVLGVALYLVFLFFPSRATTVSSLRITRRAALRPERSEARLERTRRVKWWGLGIFVAGALSAAYTLRWMVQNGVVYDVVIGGVRYQSFHLVGYLLLGVGAIMFVAAALREGPLTELEELGHLALAERPPVAEGSEGAPPHEDEPVEERPADDAPDDLAEDREDEVPAGT